MLQYCFQVYFMLSIIIQFRNNPINAFNILPSISPEKRPTEVDDVTILPGVLQENETTEIVSASNILASISQEDITVEVIDSSNFLSGILEERGTAKVADLSNSLPNIFQKNGTTKVIKTSNILPGISQENDTTKLVDASNTLSGISEENGTTELVDASNMLPSISKKNGTTELGEASNILPDTSQENVTVEVVDSSNFLSRIFEKHGSAKVTELSNTLPDILQENGTTEIINTTNILPGISQKNRTTQEVSTSNILPGVSQENGTTEVVDASNISPGISQENAILKLIDACNIFPGITQENDSTEVVDVSNILQDISQENGTTEEVDNILPSISQENITREILDASNIFSGFAKQNIFTEEIDVSNTLPGISQENGTTEAVDSFNVSPGISQENGIRVVVDASNIFPGISEENCSTGVVDASNILPSISQGNITGEVEQQSIIFLSISQENGTGVVVDKSNILSGISQENGTTEGVDASNILPGISQENGTTEVVDAYNIFPSFSQENITGEVEQESNVFFGISQENGTGVVVDASNILPGISKENGTTEGVETSNILPGISQENGTREVVETSNSLPGISQENGITEGMETSNIFLGISQQNVTTEGVDASNIFPSISQENGATERIETSNILPGISQDNGTTEVVETSNILSVISQENRTTEGVETSIIFLGISQENGTGVVVDTSNILPSILQENGITEVVDASNNFLGILKENGTGVVVDASNILPGISQENITGEVVGASNIFPKQTFEPLPRSCYGLQLLGGVCTNEDGTITQSDPLFSVNEIYELTFNDTKYLPARALFGFSVQHLVLDDPDVTVDEDVFYGTKRLNGFYVRRSSIEVIPDFKIVKDTIEIISIQSSHLASLEGENLQNLTMVKDLLFRNNSIRFIDPDVFKGTENVLILDLFRNCLTSIPPNLLDSMKNLRLFLAGRNNLLHVDNLFSITHPQGIYLFSNNITDVESVLHVNMKNVRSLNLAGNPITNLTVNSFNRKIGNARTLSLRYCQIKKFNVEYFYMLFHLENLDLAYNLIEEDSDAYSESFGVGNEGTTLFEVETFDLTGNKLKSISKILKYKDILTVKIAKNQIQYLTNEDFRFVHKTEHLELQENQIRRIDTDTFKPIRASLSYLNLSSNSISSLNGSVRYLSQIRKLSITNNLIQFFASDEFAGLNELDELHLQHNHIKALWQFQQLPYLRYLYVTDNDIKLIRTDQVPKSLTYMDLEGNPIQCDCRLQPFLHLLNTNDFIETNFGLCMQSVHKTSNCPDMCSCGCVNNGNDYFMSVDCRSKGLTVLPHFLRNGYPQTEGNETVTSDDHSLLMMKDNIYPAFDLEDRVLGVNLENNSLESLEGIQLPPDLIQLYLANNKLRRLPDSILENQVNLRNVSLSGNPWNCDCDALRFKRWLTSLRHDAIQDIDNVRCAASDKGESTLNGRVIGTLTELELCPKDLALVVTASIGVLAFATLCLSTIMLYKKYELHIKVFLYSRGFTFVKEKDLDDDKVFDAFLSFCHLDDKFVIEDIISVIEERDPTIHLCIHYRHFMPGEYIYDNIIWAVRNSKRTVIILSKNFLESEWCLMEFRTAHMQTLEDKVHRIVVIKVGDLPREMDPAIKTYLDSTTYLTWGEKNFWNKLLYVLPTGGRIRNSFQEI